MAKSQKNESLQKFRAAVREILVKLKLRKPKDRSIEFCLRPSFFESDDSIYGSIYEEYSNTTKKRLPNTGSNFLKTPILFEIPKINNPAAWVSSKTQKDTKPIRN